MNSQWTFNNDLQSIHDRTKNIFSELDGSRIFLTGGTGFIGRWLLESIAYSMAQSNIDMKVTILSRRPDLFRIKAPHLFSNPHFTFVQGNVNDVINSVGYHTHIIHAATDASADLNANNPKLMFNTVLDGTKNILEFAEKSKIKRILYLSSGAVYGVQPPEILNVQENWLGAPDCLNPVNAYAEAKRAAEMLCAIYVKQYGLEISIARIFALLGPLLTLDIHFAAGNFIKDAIDRKTIIVKSSGKAVRSYLYPVDLIVWLMYIFVKGSAGKAYNVGSDQAISIGELAQLTANLIGGGRFEILGQDDPGWNPGRYVPDVSLIKNDLGLVRTVNLEQAIINTALSNGWIENK